MDQTPLSAQTEIYVQLEVISYLHLPYLATVLTHRPHNNER